MKIPLSKHIEYCSVRFNEVDSKLIWKIDDYLDKKLNEMYLNRELGRSDLTEDEDIWKLLLTMFNSLKDGKLTKAFIYQMLVLNDMTSCETNSKMLCCIRKRDCPIKVRRLESINRTISSFAESDFNNICCNLAICIRLADGEIPLDYPAETKFIEIDDRILNKDYKK